MNNTYNYNFASPSGGAQEPVVTSTSGDTSPKPVDPHPNYGASGVARLRSRLALATATPPDVPANNNEGNLRIAEDKLGMQPVNSKEMVEFSEKMADRNFNRMALYASTSNIGNALGGNVDYQQWWSGGLVK